MFLQVLTLKPMKKLWFSFYTSRRSNKVICLNFSFPPVMKLKPLICRTENMFGHGSILA